MQIFLFLAWKRKTFGMRVRVRVRACVCVCWGGGGGVPISARLRKNDATPSWIRPEGVVSCTTAHVMWRARGCATGALLML